MGYGPPLVALALRPEPKVRRRLCSTGGPPWSTDSGGYEKLGITRAHHVRCRQMGSGKSVCAIRFEKTRATSHHTNDFENAHTIERA